MLAIESLPEGRSLTSELKDHFNDHAQAARRLEDLQIEFDDEYLRVIVARLAELAWAQAGTFRMTLLELLGQI